MSIRIVLPGVPPSINRFAGRTNAWEYRAAKKHWTEAVAWAARAQRPHEPYQRARVEILYYFPDRRRHDADNYAGKFLLDGLTHAGIIVDDDFSHIQLGVAGAVDAREPRTVITVTEMEEIGEKENPRRDVRGEVDMV